MKKLLMITGVAAAVIILGIGIYQTDASQKNQLLSESAIKELIDSQYPGEIKTVEQQEDNYKIEIHHKGHAYELIVDGSDGSVQQLVEGRSLVKKEIPDGAGARPPENKTEKPDQESEPDEAQEAPVEESPVESNMETSIEKSPSKTESESKPKLTDKKVKKEKKEPKKKEKEQQQKQEKKEKKDQEKQPTKAAISEADAVEIALGEFPGDIEQIDLEEDDGRLFYEIEVKRGDSAAEIGIDAYSGEIIYMEIDD